MELLRGTSDVHEALFAMLPRRPLMARDAHVKGESHDPQDEQRPNDKPREKGEFPSNGFPKRMVLPHLQDFNGSVRQLCHRKQID